MAVTCMSRCARSRVGRRVKEPNATGRELIDVSEGEGGKQVSGGPRVQGVMAISPDGSHVYFVAQGVLTDAR